MVLKKLGVSCCNIIFPPFAVYLLCGSGEDLFINCCLFILAVFPSHFHAAYISWTYFWRKRKVRKGRYPGDWKSGIFAEKVQNGGASDRKVEALRKEQKRMLDRAVKKEKQESRAKRSLKQVLGRKKVQDEIESDSIHDEYRPHVAQISRQNSTSLMRQDHGYSSRSRY
jgi:uncharacterized membrane protein YqaE (UPF0057 family)